MAQQRNRAELKLSCSICLDLLKDPVTIPCGHNYCMKCIKDHWDTEDEKRIYSCPQCRRSSTPRPELLKNTMLAELAEELKKTDHKGHDTVSAATERAEKQKQLAQSRQNVQQRIQDREKDVKELQQEVETTNRSADEAVEHSEKIFTQMIRLVETRRSDVKQRIRSQQELDASLAKERQDKLNQEITELKKKDAELVKLLLTEDHTQFLHSYPSLSTLTESTISPRPNIDRLQAFEDVTAAVTAARDLMQLILTEKLRLRTEFLQYSRQITLDPNTAERRLVLSEENRRVTRNDKNPPYPRHPDRFTDTQVLSKEGLTGRCYWEVEKKKKSGDVEVAVAYKSVDRSGEFGDNKKSWSLRCYCDGSYIFYHDSQDTFISGPLSSRIGVYLDHSAGILSFYSVSSDTMRLLHRVQTTFTEPLHAGLCLGSANGNTAEVCKVQQ